MDANAGAHGTIYVVAMSKDESGNYYHRLHALDITTGAEEFGGPVTIQASYPGKGANSQNGRVIFDPKQYKDRAALLLVGGVVYTSWGSHCDFNPYTGWLIGYDQLSLHQTSVFILRSQRERGGTLEQRQWSGRGYAGEHLRRGGQWHLRHHTDRPRVSQ